MRHDTKTVAYDVEVLKVTEKAMQCRILDDSGEEKMQVWFPCSQCDLLESTVSGVGDIGTLVVSEWIAMQKGLL